MNADRQDFETLVGPHFEALYRAAFRLTRRCHDAEDLVQEVCLRAFSELERLKSLDSVLGWMLHVQYRVFVDGDRRRRRSPVEAYGDRGVEADDWASESPGPADLAESMLQRRELDLAWSRLSSEQRALLALHAEGYGLAELAEITGRNRNAVSARLHRARRRLSKMLGLSVGSAGLMTPR